MVYNWRRYSKICQCRIGEIRSMILWLKIAFTKSFIMRMNQFFMGSTDSKDMPIYRNVFEWGKNTHQSIFCSWEYLLFTLLDRKHRCRLMCMITEICNTTKYQCYSICPSLLLATSLKLRMKISLKISVAEMQMILLLSGLISTEKFVTWILRWHHPL